MCIAGRTLKEYKEDNKEYLLEYKKQYRQDNKTDIAEHNKQYYINNKLLIVELFKQTIVCNCGTISNKYQLQRHIKTNKHTININNLYLNELNYYIL